VKKLVALLVACLASVLFFAAVFRAVDRPLTLGDITRSMNLKAAYARSLVGPKLAIWAGSNGRYSHRCQPFSAETGLPCVNLSVAVGLGIDFQLQQIEGLLNPGDILYVPLEYGQYFADRAEMEGGAENTVLVHDRPDLLWTLPPQRIARAWGYFDLTFLVHGLIETGLSHTGFQRRTGLQTLTPQGDEFGHTALKAGDYRAYLAQLKQEPVTLPPRSHAFDVLGAFLDRARARGVTVVGGLPTSPLDTRLDLAALERLRNFYIAHGQRFVLLPNRSQYPLSCFYDSLSHLNEESQIDHSHRVGRALAAELHLGPGAAS
jgi:hypothetical protein